MKTLLVIAAMFVTSALCGQSTITQYFVKPNKATENIEFIFVFEASRRIKAYTGKFKSVFDLKYNVLEDNALETIFGTFVIQVSGDAGIITCGQTSWDVYGIGEFGDN